MTFAEIEQNIGNWVFFCCAPDDLPEQIHPSGFGVVVGVKLETKYSILLDISYLYPREKEYDFTPDEIKFIVPDKNSKIFKLLTC